MRKLLVPWLLAIFGLLLSSCGGTPGGEATATPVTSGATGATATSGGAGTAPVAGGKSITFMTPPWGVPPKQEDLTAFEQQTGVHVEVISLPMDQLYSKVQVAAAAKQKPADVIFLSEEAPSFVVEPGYMEPLNSYISGSNGIDTGDFDRLDFWTRDGKTYGVTTYVQMVMLDYNEAKLKQGGFTDPPKTWDEFHTQALALKSKGVDEYPVAFGAIDWSWYLIALSMGDPMFDDSQNPVFANQGSQGRKAMSLLVDMLTKDKLITPAALSDQTPHAIFMGGVGVFHQSWQGANGLMNNADKSKQAPNVRYMLMPDQHYTWSLDAAIGISKDSDNKDAAWQFIKWYVTEAQQRAIYDAFGLVPSRKSVQAALNKEGKIAQYDTLQEQAKSIHQLPRYTKWWGPWSTKVTEQIRIAAQGSQSADQTVDNIAKAWNDLKAEYTK